MTLNEFLEKYKNKTYLGDSVYVWFDGYAIILESNDGCSDETRNVILLQHETLASLNNYYDKLAEDCTKINSK